MENGKCLLQQIEEAQRISKKLETEIIQVTELEQQNLSPPQPSTPQPPKSKDVAVATGTGFLFGSQDYIVTNYHVVKGTSEVKVKFTNGESINATSNRKRYAKRCCDS